MQHAGAGAGAGAAAAASKMKAVVAAAAAERMEGSSQELAALLNAVARAQKKH